VPFILGGASLPLIRTPYFSSINFPIRPYSIVFNISGFTMFGYRAYGGHEPRLLGYPARSLVTVSTELFQLTKFDTNDVFSIKYFVVEGFQKQKFRAYDVLKF
jgi:hypothetical protein